jgi:hypothetical protein
MVPRAGVVFGLRLRRENWVFHIREVLARHYRMGDHAAETFPFPSGPIIPSFK